MAPSPHRPAAGGAENRHPQHRPGRTSSGTVAKTTGIERSYDSVTQTLKAVASFASGTDGSRGRSAAGASARSSNASAASRGSRGSSVPGRNATATRESRTRSLERRPSSAPSASLASSSRPSLASHSTGASGRAFSNLGPPPPVASFSFDAHDDAGTLASTQNSVSQSAIGAHLKSISASMSADEFDRLRSESRELRAAHEKKYADKTFTAASKKQGKNSPRAKLAKIESGKALDSSGPAVTHSTSTNVVDNRRQIFRESRSRESVDSHGSNLQSRSHHHLPNPKEVGKGVVKLSAAGLKKITHILHANSKDDDVMSFYCSDEKGEVRKQKVSLDGTLDGPETALALTGLPQSPTRASLGSRGSVEEKRYTFHLDPKDGETAAARYRREMQEKEEKMIRAAKKAGRKARESLNGTLDAVVGEAARATHEGVELAAKKGRESLDVSKAAVALAAPKSVRKAATSARRSVDHAVEAVAPKLGEGIKAAAPKLSTAARATAQGVAKVGRESVEGVGMLAKDLSAMKTPARSNVTRHQGDYHVQAMLAEGGLRTEEGGEYVHDPAYEVALTPPHQGNVRHAGKTPYAYGDPQTPGCLLGAVAAGRCGLPEDDPESLEFLPRGMPRVLVVPDDWEERAGFVATTSKACSVGRLVGGGTDEAAKVGGGGVAASPTVEGFKDDENKESKASRPIDVDEETETMNGEEIDLEEMAALREGLPSPRMANSKKATFENDEAAEEEEESGSEGEENEENDPRNASLWVAVPDVVEDDDSMDEDEEAERPLRVEDINLSELLLADQAKPSPAFSMGSRDTFFVGDVNLGTAKEAVAEEEAPVEKKEGKVAFAEQKVTVEDASDEASRDLVSDAKSWSPGSKSTHEEEASVATAVKVPVAPTKIEDLDIGAPNDRPQAAIASEDEDTLVSLATRTAAAVVDDHKLHKADASKSETKAPFKTPHSVRRGERPLSLEEFRAMHAPSGDETGVQQVYGATRPLCHEQQQGLYADPSLSTELSHEPPLRVVDGGVQSHHARPSSTSTGLSALSHWKPDVARASNDTGAAADGKRPLKGRVILVRIKKKLSKVAKKMLFLPLRSHKTGVAAVCDSPSFADRSFVVSLPRSSLVASPSESVLSVASSLLTGTGSAVRIIGAVPAKVGDPTPHQTLYGTINYGGRCFGGEESTVGADELPSPPANMPRPRTAGDESAAVSYLAEAMQRATCNDEDDDDDEEEDSVLLLVTPKDDGTEEICQIVSAQDGTPLHVRDVIEAAASENAGDETANSEVKPNNLAGLFTDEKGTPIQILDATEVDGQLVLTPPSGADRATVARVFRPSTGSATTALRPGSTIASEDDDDGTLLYHDGCTVVHQTSTFGDYTIDTRSTLKDEAHDKAAVAKKKKKALTPDGPALAQQAAKNGSFLFSPDNMGRAAPEVRAKERASLKDGKVPPSITMLPAAGAKKAAGGGTKAEPEAEEGLVMRQRMYSLEPSLATAAEAEVDDDPLALRQSYSFEEASPMRDSEAEENEETEGEAKQPMASMTEDRQFSFRTILHKFSTDASESPPAKPAQDDDDEEEEMLTPLVTNAGSKKKKKYPATPYPEADVGSEASPPAATNAASTSPLSTASATSSKAATRKKPSPNHKTVPKSALRTRKGLVKDRVSDIQLRLAGAGGAATAAQGRLKRNHPYRLKASRRMTDGKGALAPRKAVLRTTYIRSVPIAIAKTYSRDSRESAGTYVSQEEEQRVQEEERVQEANAEDGDDSDGESAAYAFKYTSSPKPVESFEGSASPANGRPSLASDASSCVSETTDAGDPFTSLLSKMTDVSGSDEEEEEESAGGRTEVAEKENAASSPSAHLPFKSSTLVKPTELNQHQRERAPLSPVPAKAQSWRNLAAAHGKNNSNSVRFRSESSWRQLAGGQEE